MAARLIVPQLYEIPLGAVNVFLLEDSAGLTLIDAGIRGSGERLLAALRELGRQPGDIRRIIVTHCHPDHAGDLAALKRATGAPALMHPLDAPIVSQGLPQRPLTPTPGLLNGILFRLFIRPMPFEPAPVEQLVNDGDELPIAGGLRVIHIPGHCAGQIALHWPQHGGVLFAADAASHMMGLGLSIGYEDLAEGKRSLAKLAGLDFATACFGHGTAIVGGAAEQFRRRWGGAAALA
jgi:glyoxylase-like metal-dependent hydrolase (beta-lactamase superfamily II)